LGKLVTKLLITMLTLLITSAIIPGMTINGLWAGFWAALLLGVVNLLVKPVITVLTLPITILSLGLFLFIINGLMLLLTAALVPGFAVNGILVAILGSIVLSIVSSLLDKLFN